MKSPPHGLLLFHKKPGLTSFESLKCVKRAFATGKAGHTGTLDKFASGLLLLLVGKGVKLASLFSGCVKEYEGTIVFGEETDTLDPEGELVAKGRVPSLAEVEAVLDLFRGDILQAPPEYSAIHINGRRAHEIVRSGEAPEMKKRPVTIYTLEIISWLPPKAVVRVRCSAGTYIRSLARDIAIAAGSRAFLGALKRTKVGNFCLEDSVEDSGDDEILVKALRPLDKKLFEELSMPYFLIDDMAAEGFFHGKPLKTLLAGGELITPSAAGYAPLVGKAGNKESAGVFRKKTSGGGQKDGDELLGVITSQNDEWRYIHVFSPPAFSGH